MKKPAAADITQAIIDGWKNEYSKVMRYEAEDGKVAYFKNPDLTAIDAAQTMVHTNPVKSNVLLAKACFIGGDEEVINEDKYVLGLGKHLSKMIVKVEGELTEL